MHPVINAQLLSSSFELQVEFFFFLVIITMARDMENLWFLGHPRFDTLKVNRLLRYFKLLISISNSLDKFGKLDVKSQLEVFKGAQHLLQSNLVCSLVEQWI
jgi:hypothetical protein